MHIISINTYIAVAFFVLAYMIFIVIKTARQQLDLYDLVMLSMVALVPAVFTFCPGLAYWVADLAGVAFPFVIMFGVLFLILFLLVHRLTIKIHKLEMDNHLLIQEIGLLRNELESLWKRIRSDSATLEGRDLSNEVSRAE
jgi:hypothetical protein